MKCTKDKSLPSECNVIYLCTCRLLRPGALSRHQSTTCRKILPRWPALFCKKAKDLSLKIIRKQNNHSIRSHEIRLKKSCIYLCNNI